MVDINAILHQIAGASFGADVRQSIYDAIDFIHNEYLTIKTVAEQMHELIGMYEGYVAQAKELTGKLDEQITTGTGLKEDLTDLNATLSDGRQVLAELKTENGKATTNIEEAQEKIEIIQGLLEQFPDLDTAGQIADRLEAAYNSAVEAVSMIEPVEELVKNLTEQNTEAQTNLDAYNQAKSDIETLKQTVEELNEQITNYPQVIEELNTAYQTALEALNKLGEAQDTATQLEELNNQAQDNLTRYDEAKTTIDELIEKTTQLETVIEGYPEVVQQLEDAYNQVKDSITSLEELKQLLAEIDADTQIINENKEALGAVAQNIDIIKQFIEMGGVDLGEFETRLSAIEHTLSGLEETLENLI